MFNSAVSRLTVWYAALLALFMVLFAIGSYFVFEKGLLDQTDRAMSDVAALFEEKAIEEIEDEEVDEEDLELEDEFKAAFEEASLDVNFANFKIIVFSNERVVLTQSKSSLDKSKFDKQKPESLFDGFSGDTQKEFRTVDDANGSTRILFKKIAIEKNVSFLFVVHSLDEQERILESIRTAFLLIIPIALLFSVLGGFFMARKSFAPIGEMTKKAEKINSFSLHERLLVSNKESELGRLARSFNDLLKRLDKSFEQQRRFMADASHELRTPAAILRGEAEVSLRGPVRPAEEYKESLAIIQSEAERMSVIIEDLFILARADAGENLVSLSYIHLEDIVDDGLTSFRSLAAKRSIDLRHDPLPSMPLRADEQLLKRLFSNLIDNAVKHANTVVSVRTRNEPEFYSIEIENDGDAIPKNSQPHIFERFYKADEARTRTRQSSSGSGAGLGLAISKWIAESHNAELNLVKSDSKGTILRFQIPTE